MVVGRLIAYPFDFSIYAMLIDLKDGFHFIRVILQRRWSSRLRSSRFKEAGIKLWVNSSHDWGKIQLTSTRFCRYYVKRAYEAWFQLANAL